MSEVLLNARKFTVERRHYALPGRDPVSREIVVHPGAVLILPLLDDDRIVMIHNYRYAVERELLELPAGTIERGEPPETCAARELEEETGYRAASIESIGRFYTTPGFTDELMWCYVARGLTRTQQDLDAGENIRPEIVRWADAIEWVRDGTIVDGKTIAALLHYHTYGRAR